MNFQVDSSFYKGEEHLTCQDYALHGIQETHLEHKGIFQPIKIPYIIISDGCSMSNNSDFGARALCFMIRSNLLKYIRQTASTEKAENIFNAHPKYFEEDIKIGVKTLINTLQLDHSVFDATLLFAFVINKKLYVYQYGDGGFIRKIKDVNTNLEKMEIYNRKYLSGAPNYVTYQIYDRYRIYQHNYGRFNVIDQIEMNEDKNNIGIIEIEKKIGEETSCYTFDLEKEDITFISLFSDGTSHYMRKYVDEYDIPRLKQVPLKEIIEHSTDYKNPVGEFVKRGMIGMDKYCKATECYPNDDISWASIHISR